jgi:hypothetical protein
MIEISYLYKNREFIHLEDSFLNQLAEKARKMLNALLEHLHEAIMQEKGRILINLDTYPRIEMVGFSVDLRDRIERTWRGEE